jgi:hypothetical protein
MNFGAMVLRHHPPMRGEINHNHCVQVLSVQALSTDTLLAAVREIWPSVRYRVYSIEGSWRALKSGYLLAFFSLSYSGIEISIRKYPSFSSQVCII